MPYIYINNYSQKGKLGISLATIDTIASKAVAEIPGASVYSAAVEAKKDTNSKNSKSKDRKTHFISPLFSVPSGAKTSLSKTGKAIIKLDEALAPGLNVSEICLKIQKQVADALRLNCDTLPYEVMVHVAKIMD